MKAIVQRKYGLPDVLEFENIDKPVVKDDEVLVRVSAAAVNIGDWHLLRGVPYVMRLVVGLLTPKREIPGLDIAGQVEVVGLNVTQFRPGDEVFGWCRGAFAEYACAAENNLLPKPANLTFEQSAAVGDSAFTAMAAVRDQGKAQPPLKSASPACAIAQSGASAGRVRHDCFCSRGPVGEGDRNVARLSEYRCRLAGLRHFLHGSRFRWV